MQDYRKLQVWQKGHVLTLDIYRLTKTFLKEEVYGLVSQMRRSASSIPANIAEGCGRDSNAQLKQFLSIASGSAFELDYHLLLAHDLEFVKLQRYDRLHDQIDNIRRMFNNFMARLKTKNELRTTNDRGAT